jgi:hypothetical protein
LLAQYLQLVAQPLPGVLGQPGAFRAGIIPVDHAHLRNSGFAYPICCEANRGHRPALVGTGLVGHLAGN